MECVDTSSPCTMYRHMGEKLEEFPAPMRDEEGPREALEKRRMENTPIPISNHGLHVVDAVLNGDLGEGYAGGGGFAGGEHAGEV
jgi:hypothetical protein